VLVQTRSPERLVCTMDADWRPAFRVAALPSYKAHRVAEDGGDQTPDPLERQLPIIDAVLDAFGLAKVGVPGYEADDVIGTLATRAVADSSGPVDIVTGDRDLFQLVDERGPVQVLYTARGIRNLQVMGEKEVAAKYGIPGRGYADFATLRGDPSDGLPGVPGVGDKTAAALVSRFGPGHPRRHRRGQDRWLPRRQPAQAGGRPRLSGHRADRRTGSDQHHNP
jgi:5'-3' exonuclease